MTNPAQSDSKIAIEKETTFLTRCIGHCSLTRQVAAREIV